MRVQRTNRQPWSLSATTNNARREAEAAQVLVNRKANALVTGCAVSCSRDDGWNAAASMYRGAERATDRTRRRG